MVPIGRLLGKFFKNSLEVMEYIELFNKSKVILLSKGYEFIESDEIFEHSVNISALNNTFQNIINNTIKFLNISIRSTEFDLFVSNYIAAGFLLNKNFSLDAFLSQKSTELFYNQCYFLLKTSFLLSVFWSLVFNAHLDTLAKIHIDSQNKDMKAQLLSLIADIRNSNKNSTEYLSNAFKLRRIYNGYIQELSLINMESKYVSDWLSKLISHEKNCEFQSWSSISQSLKIDDKQPHYKILTTLGNEMKRRVIENEKMEAIDNETKKVSDNHKNLETSITKYKNQITAICNTLEKVETSLNNYL